jgi:hypothetical protein
MKQEFKILKNRPKVTIMLTRDSVCAGDDVDAPHNKRETIYSFVDPSTFVSNINIGYLPTVAGFGHTWDCMLNRKLIARIYHDRTETFVDEIIYEKTNEVHFIYNAANY